MASDDKKSFAFCDLPADAFPFTVEYIDKGTVIWSVTVDGPGALAVPPAKDCGASGPVHVRVTYAKDRGVLISPEGEVLQEWG